jgi:hypothetical protein
MARKRGEHYVNNKEFSQAVGDYVRSCREAEKEGKSSPIISRYIGECFLKMSNKIASRPNFFGYSYKDEMIMDGVENCVKAIENYDIEKAASLSKSGVANAFGYFTRIIWFAFLRRIQKEKKQQEIKEKVMDQADISDFAEVGNSTMGNSLVANARKHNDMLKGKNNDGLTSEERKIIKAAEKKERGPMGLENFYE